MFQKTNLSMVETDGPYGGYPCAANHHAHHKGFSDSVYWQQQLQSRFYKQLIEEGVYINQPDRYFYQGGHRTGTNSRLYSHFHARSSESTVKYSSATKVVDELEKIAILVPFRS